MMNDINQFLCDGVVEITMYFKDDNKITIGYLLEYDFNFSKINNSYVSFRTALANKELIDKFCEDDYITCLHIESKYTFDNNTTTIDVPCDMRIKSLRTNGDMEHLTEMYVQLEGVVK